MDKRHLLIQCRHELCANDGHFDLGKISPRWHRMEEAPICFRTQATILPPIPVFPPPETAVDEGIHLMQDGNEEHEEHDEEAVEGEPSLSQVHGDATPQSPTRKISYSRLRELSTYLVDLTMAGSDKLKHQVAGFLAMGIEAIKNNGEVCGMSLQQHPPSTPTFSHKYQQIETLLSTL